MKRIIFLLLAIIFIFCGCSNTIISSKHDNKIDTEDLPVYENTTSNYDESIIKNSDEFIGAWFSYLELFPKEFIISELEYKLYIQNRINDLKAIKVTDLFVQVRSFADSIYPSKFNVSSALVSSKQGGELKFDYLKAIIDVSRENNIKVHAWLNPYRVQSGEFDINELSENNIARIWLEEKSGNINVIENGVYFSPSSTQVQQLIVDSVRELLTNYDLDGIHIDDYFYPTTDESFESELYMKYKSNGGMLNLDDFRRENVNALVSSIYSTVKSFSNDIIFSISPSGDIEKNFSYSYCDVELWLNNVGYADMIIPQIYFGFENESLPFEECLNEWLKLKKNDDVKLAIGLALYKCNQEDVYAGENGENEWLNNQNVISRQVEMLREKDCSGFVLFSVSNVKFTNLNTKNELQNLKNVIQ